MGVIIEKLIDWQFLNMNASEEDATKYIESDLKNYNF